MKRLEEFNGMLKKQAEFQLLLRNKELKYFSILTAEIKNLIDRYWEMVSEYKIIDCSGKLIATRHHTSNHRNNYADLPEEFIKFKQQLENKIDQYELLLTIALSRMKLDALRGIEW